MKRSFALLLSLVLLGALALGATVVRADGSDDNETACATTGAGSTSGEDSGGHGDSRVIRADRHDGTSASDDESGDASDDTMDGRAGDDDLNGEAGDDDICGDDGDDTIEGGTGDDHLSGGRGDDNVQGQQGDDVEQGNAGDDTISGGSGHDKLSGGAGNDRINARDGHRDRVTCGSGRDSVRADRSDVVSKDCEKVSR